MNRLSITEKLKNSEMFFNEFFEYFFRENEQVFKWLLH